MLKSETKISFENRKEVEKDLEKTLINYNKTSNSISQKTYLHHTEIAFFGKEASIKVRFSKNFYIFYVLVGIFISMLPFENALIGTAALAIFIIFSAIMYFSLDYKLKTILDGFS